MKRYNIQFTIVVLLFTCFLWGACSNEKVNNTVEINVKNKIDSEEGMLYLVTINNDSFDSIQVKKNGIYELNLPEAKPIILTAYYESKKNRKAVNFLAVQDVKTKIDLEFNKDELDLSSKNVTYCANNQMISDFSDFQATMEKFTDRDYQLQKDWKTLLAEYNGDGTSIPEEVRKPVDEESMAIMNEKKEYLGKYVENHNDITSLYIYNTHLRFSYGYDKLEKILDATPDSLKNTLVYKNLNEKKETLKRTRIGAIAPDIVKPTPDGKELALSSLRGKYVLLDFWASWCAPCRKENPWVKKAYERFHKKGFDIYAVSFDYPGDKEKWLQAIKNDGLNWNHVSSLKGWKDTVAKEYNISGIPAPFLLDPEGKIIAKGNKLRGEGLMKTLEEYLE